MVSIDTPRVEWLERRSPALFLVGGGLIVGHAAVRGVQAFTEVAVQGDVFGPAGFLLAAVGLYGLYPGLADRAPALARGGAATAAVLLAGWTVISAWGLGQVAGVAPPQSDVLPGAFYVGHLAVMVLTYGLFGAAVLRTDVHSGAVGVLLLAPPVLIVAMLAGTAVAGDAALGAFLVGSGQALAHLAIGYSLRIESGPAGREIPTGDATAG